MTIENRQCDSVPWLIKENRVKIFQCILIHFEQMKSVVHGFL